MTYNVFGETLSLTQSMMMMMIMNDLKHLSVYAVIRSIETPHCSNTHRQHPTNSVKALKEEEAHIFIQDH